MLSLYIKCLKFNFFLYFIWTKRYFEHAINKLHSCPMPNKCIFKLWWKKKLTTTTSKRSMKHYLFPNFRKKVWLYVMYAYTLFSRLSVLPFVFLGLFWSFDQNHSLVGFLWSYLMIFGIFLGLNTWSVGRGTS